MLAYKIIFVEKGGILANEQGFAMLGISIPSARATAD
jgi:hypothetical protein